MKPYVIIAALNLTLFASCSDKNKGSEVATKETGKDTMQLHGTKGHGTDHSKMEGMGDMKGMSGMENMKDMSSMDNEAAGELVLNDVQVKLGGIEVDTLRNGVLGDKMVLTATINVDQNKTTSVSSRVVGRVERLYYKNLGEYVPKGARLYDLYSEELNNAKQEYILAIERKKPLANSSVIDFDQLIEGARNKLLLWGMNVAQINELETTKKTTFTTTFYSNAGGYITMLEIKEGDYVMEGGTVVRLADLSSLWAEAQVYSSQLAQIDKTAVAIVQIPDLNGLQLKGRITFVNPELNPDTRINLVRVRIPNTGNRLRPGMPAYVFLNNGELFTMSLPIDAVIRGKDGASVWVQTGKNTYRSRMVQTGMESGNRIEIKSGLKPGDVVVVSGVFWLNSELIFSKGGNAMEGMNM